LPGKTGKEVKILVFGTDCCASGNNLKSGELKAKKGVDDDKGYFSEVLCPGIEISI
jgi:hypothetical protein